MSNMKHSRTMSPQGGAHVIMIKTLYAIESFLLLHSNCLCRLMIRLIRPIRLFISLRLISLHLQWKGRFHIAFWDGMDGYHRSQVV